MYLLCKALWSFSYKALRYINLLVLLLTTIILQHRMYIKSLQNNLNVHGIPTRPHLKVLFPSRFFCTNFILSVILVKVWIIYTASCIRIFILFSFMRGDAIVDAVDGLPLDLNNDDIISCCLKFAFCQWCCISNNTIISWTWRRGMAPRICFVNFYYALVILILSSTSVVYQPLL